MANTNMEKEVPKKGKLTKEERAKRNVKISKVPKGSSHQKIIKRLVRRRQIFNPEEDTINVSYENVPKSQYHQKYINKAKSARFLRENFSYRNNVFRAIFFSVALIVVLVPSITLSVYCTKGGQAAVDAFPDMTGNDGIAFGLTMPVGGIYAIQAVLCVVLIGIVLFSCSWYMILCGGLSTVGGLYNLIDRGINKTLANGHYCHNEVLDYIGMDSTICNVPDIMVIIGVCGLVVLTIVEIIIEAVQEKKEKQKVSSMFKVEILYENDALMVVNKPNGLLVHPTSHNEKNTLVDILKSKIHVNEFEDKTRPGIVQRLDQYTTGLMVVAKTKSAAESLTKQISDKTLVRKYRAIVHNPFKENEDEVVVKAPIDRSKSGKLKFVVSNAKTAKPAETEVFVVSNYEVGALVECSLLTGRTHQIRVHLSYIHHPIYNDPLYGHNDGFKDYGQFLHSHYIKFKNPVDHKVLEFTAEPDAVFKELERTLSINKEDKEDIIVQAANATV